MSALLAALAPAASAQVAVTSTALAPAAPEAAYTGSNIGRMLASTGGHSNLGRTNFGGLTTRTSLI